MFGWSKKDTGAKDRSTQSEPTVRSLLIARTPPWNRIAPKVIDAILEGITDKALLEAFVMVSMKHKLVARYEALGWEKSDSVVVIRAQISHVLCQIGNRTMPALAKALEAKQTDAATTAFALVNDTFEPAIALAKNQIVAYAQLSTAWGMLGKRAECHDWAQRGLAELEAMREEIHRLNVPIHKMLGGIPADALDQMVEQQLRGYLEL